ncbi:unnamed protein product [Lupinus luteus]|uniref:Polyadenylate-binding protein n=1 Tax=Lupinus luteus TaxID=3873 RepID=A0AAV1W976_LUPLU
MEHLPKTPNTESENPRERIRLPESLYIWSIDKNVTESQLFDLFNQVAQVVSVSISRDLTTGKSLRSAYVHFNNYQDATKALHELNETLLNNKPLKIVYSTRDIDRKKYAANIFIKNLDKAIHFKQLYDICSPFGNIISCKITKDATGQSKGYGYAQFDNEESAQNAIDNLNGKLVNDKQIYVSHFRPKEVRNRHSVLSGDTSKFTSLYVKNLPEWLTEIDLKNFFGEFGTITNAIVMREIDGSSKQFGFVNFENPDSAAKALEALNGMNFDGRSLYVRRSLKKSERELELKKAFEQIMKEAAEKLQYVNLYINNLHECITGEDLRELFSVFGRVVSYQVIHDPEYFSSGYGFVEFSTPEEANQALHVMNGEVVAGRKLFVALAMKNQERRTTLEAQFSQMSLLPMSPPAPVAPHIPLSPLRFSDPGQQFLFGQPLSVSIPQAGFGFQQQLVPGTIMPSAPFPNFLFPQIQQGQHEPWSGGSRGSSSSRQSKREPPMLFEQVLSRSPVYWYPTVHNTGNAPWPALAGGMLADPYDRGGVPIWDASEQPVATNNLSRALANASPEEQRTILGEALYPLVHNLEPDSAEKITGMILEMDKHDILDLIESPVDLKEKVTESMDLLRCYIYQED